MSFKPGDIVDITIEGARVRAIRGEDIVDPSYETEGCVASVALTESVTVEVALTESVTIERVAPAEWPPRPGDLWRDRDGLPWFAVEHPGHTGPHLRTINDSIAPADHIARR